MTHAPPPPTKITSEQPLQLPLNSRQILAQAVSQYYRHQASQGNVCQNKSPTLCLLPFPFRLPHLFQQESTEFFLVTRRANTAHEQSCQWHHEFVSTAHNYVYNRPQAGGHGFQLLHFWHQKQGKYWGKELSSKPWITPAQKTQTSISRKRQATAWTQEKSYWNYIFNLELPTARKPHSKALLHLSHCKCIYINKFNNFIGHLWPLEQDLL